MARRRRMWCLTGGSCVAASPPTALLSRGHSPRPPPHTPGAADFEGVPECVRADALAYHDGRCYALMAERVGPHDAATHGRRHKRCRKSVVPGQLFCTASHRNPTFRTYGTVWQHRVDCVLCNRSHRGNWPPQPPPSDTMEWVAGDNETDEMVAARPPPVVPPLLEGTVGMPRRPAAAPRWRPSPLAAVAAAVAPPSIHDRIARGYAGRATPDAVVGGGGGGGGGSSSSSGGAGEEDGDCLPYNTLLFTPRDAATLTTESRYIGPCGVRLRVRLATALQPVNWCAEPPVFRSCLARIAGMSMSSDESGGTLFVHFAFCIVPGRVPAFMPRRPPTSLQVMQMTCRHRRRPPPPPTRPPQQPRCFPWHTQHPLPPLPPRLLPLLTCPCRAPPPCGEPPAARAPSARHRRCRCAQAGRAPGNLVRQRRRRQRQLEVCGGGGCARLRPTRQWHRPACHRRRTTAAAPWCSTFW